MSHIEAMKQALKALEADSVPSDKFDQAITSLRQAIVEAEKQEPVAWRWIPSKAWKDYVLSDDKEKAILAIEHGIEVEPLYTSQKVKQKPVAWMNPMNNAIIDARKKTQIGIGDGYRKFNIPCYPYTTPPQRQPLTDEQIQRIVLEARVGEHGIGHTIARAIEEAHRIGVKE